MFFELALPGISGTLTYELRPDFVYRPEDLLGSFVVVPLKNRLTDAFIASVTTKPEFTTKVVEDIPLKVFKHEQISSLKEISKYYYEDLFKVASSLAPPVLGYKGVKSIKKKIKDLLKRGKKLDLKLLVYKNKRSEADSMDHGRKELTLDQIRVKKFMRDSTESVILLRGETGSGKTEIYIDLAKDALREDFGILILVPEIALTPQISERFMKVIPKKKLSVLHSGLNKASRYLEWLSILSGEKKVVIGTRSAVMAPVENLKWIIVDEEHDKSYKQQDTSFRFSATKIAEIRSRLEGLKLILASATPRAESYYQAKYLKNWAYIYLPPFSANFKNVTIEVVDLVKSKKVSPSLTIKAYEALRETLMRKEQSIVFYNRVGYCWSLFCPSCGYLNKCPRCSLTLRVIKSANKEYCSICGYFENLKKKCPSCGYNLINLGSGTEKVEEELNRLFPGAKVKRVDRESVKSTTELFNCLEDFRNGCIDILVSTQLISKGHDFDNLTLVVAANPDIGRNLPDFRQSERFMQLFHQLCGRLGRREKKGRMLIQTAFPWDLNFLSLKSRNYEEFLNSELDIRRRHRYPPFSCLVRLLSTSSKSLKSAVHRLEAVKDLLKSKDHIEILGPSVCYLERLKNHYRAHLLIKILQEEEINPLLDELSKTGLMKNLIVDIDPLELL